MIPSLYVCKECLTQMGRETRAQSGRQLTMVEKKWQPTLNGSCCQTQGKRVKKSEARLGETAVHRYYCMIASGGIMARFGGVQGSRTYCCTNTDYNKGLSQPGRESGTQMRGFW